MRVLFPFWSGGLRFLCCRMITLTIDKLTLIHPWFPIWNYLLTASVMQMTKLSWNWESSVKNAFISITSFWEFLRPELLRAVVLQGAASSGKAHLKLTSGRETFPSLLRESCVTADLPSDPWSADASFSLPRTCFPGREVWFHFHGSVTHHGLPQDPGSLPFGCPCCRQLSPQTLCATVSSWNLKLQWCRVGLDFLSYI